MDEPFFASLWANAAGLYQIVEAAEKLTAMKVKYLFLDEIQQVKDRGYSPDTEQSYFGKSGESCA